ncbi:MAG: DUF4430 domain-containing protein [Anaerovoracaceae bacterium]
MTKVKKLSRVKLLTLIGILTIGVIGTSIGLAYSSNHQAKEAAAASSEKASAQMVAKEESAKVAKEKKAKEEKEKKESKEKKAKQTEKKQEIKNGTDKYKTSAVPEGKPAPVEPEDSIVDNSKTLTCTLYIDYSTALKNDDLDEGTLKNLEGSGVAYSKKTVTFKEGENVYDILSREARKAGISVESVSTPGYNSKYIEGIDNLYEKDCGSQSGWQYKVNGWFPNYGCSRYKVKSGDSISWLYSCNLGKDIGGHN